jgi:hypothetical protein
MRQTRLFGKRLRKSHASSLTTTYSSGSAAPPDESVASPKTSFVAVEPGTIHTVYGQVQPNSQAVMSAANAVRSEWNLLPRLQVVCRSTTLAIVFVVFAWSLQHAFMSLTFDWKYMAFRLLSSVPNSVFQTFLYLRLRRLIPLAISHAVMDGASVLIGVLLPLLRA